MNNTLLTRLIFKKFKIKNNFNNCYHVYQDEQNFSVIFADNAGEAIEKSNISQPYKIIHHDVKARAYFQQGEIQEEIDEIQTAQQLINASTTNISTINSKAAAAIDDEVKNVTKI